MSQENSDLSHSSAPQDPSSYCVLARQYRPNSFDDLIGQDVLVQTLHNAFESNRIAQAYMLTGVRGVGKTTTARILARALNYQTKTLHAPTLKMDHLGEHCEAIMQGRHVDVIEMDAASHNGVGDIREIVEAARYRPVSARYKVYILDEVHMLSTAAFNALLKTLEEPPNHVKFIFATTEIRKVPITILSRCQRFDLRRIEPATMIAHLKKIADLEKISIDDDALTMITRSAEGSVRDALSLMDQAIAHDKGVIKAESLSSMLGLADKSGILDLFGHVIHGRIDEALTLLHQFFQKSADPVTILTDLAEFTHLVTRASISPESLNTAPITQEERKKCHDYAQKIALSKLSHLWQMLLKGIEETTTAPKPIQAADMVLIRITHSAHMPSPEEAMRFIQAQSEMIDAQAKDHHRHSDTASQGSHQNHLSQSAEPAQPRYNHALTSPSSSAQRTSLQEEGSFAHDENIRSDQHLKQHEEETPLQTLEDIIALAVHHQDIILKVSLERCVRFGALKTGHIKLNVTEDAPQNFTNVLSEKLFEWTGKRWMISVESSIQTPTYYEQKETARKKALEQASQKPALQKILNAFPGAKLTKIERNPS